MRLIAAIALTVTLAGCDIANQAADVIARDQAKSVVNSVVSAKLPGVNITPVTDCVIDNASAQEILTIAAAAATGVTQSTTDLVIEIIGRPRTLTCITEAGLGLAAL